MLVKAGHNLTVRVSRRARGLAGLGYAPGGPVLEEPAGLRDTHRSVTFIACRPGEPSGSYADGEAVTFWSGGVTVTRAPACVPLEVYVDDEPTPRGPVLSLAAGRCQERAAARAQVALARAPLLDCQARAEGARPPAAASRPGDVVVGPVAFAGLERVASQRALARYRARSGYLVKAGAIVLAGTRATLVIGRRARGWAALSYATREVFDVPDGGPAVRFQACARDEPAFSYDGPVGITTGFAGGFFLSHPGCVPLEVRAAGRRPVRTHVPFGVGRCGGRT